MARHEQQHVRERVAHLVVAAVFANVLQFVHKVEKEEQRQKAQRHKRHGNQHFAVNQSSQGFHAAVSLARRLTNRLRQLQLLWRTANQVMANRNTPPCKAIRFGKN